MNNSFKINREIYWGILVALILLFLPYLYAMLLSCPFGDDYLSAAAFEHIRGLFSQFRAVADYYCNWGGRYTSGFISPFFCWIGMLLPGYALCCVGFYLLLFVAIWFLLSTLCQPPGWRKSFLWATLFSVMVLVSLPGSDQLFYSLSNILGITLGIILTLILFALMLRIWISPGQTPGQVIMAILTVFLAAGCYEHAAVVVVILTFFFFLYAYVKNRHRLEYTFILLICLMAFGIVVFAPGNFVRRGVYETTQLPCFEIAVLMIRAVTGAGWHLILSPFVPALTAMLLLFPVRGEFNTCGDKSKLLWVSGAAVFFAVLIGIPALHWAAKFYHVDFAARTGSSYLIYLWIAAGFVAFSWAASLRDILFRCRIKGEWMLVAAVALMFVSGNNQILYRNLSDGRIAEYYRTIRDRFEFYRNAGKQTTVTVPPVYYSCWPTRPMHYDLSPISGNWLNQGVASSQGINQVREQSFTGLEASKWGEEHPEFVYSMPVCWPAGSQIVREVKLVRRVPARFGGSWDWVLLTVEGPRSEARQVLPLVRILLLLDPPARLMPDFMYKPVILFLNRRTEFPRLSLTMAIASYFAGPNHYGADWFFTTI